MAIPGGVASPRVAAEDGKGVAGHDVDSERPLPLVAMWAASISWISVVAVSGSASSGRGCTVVVSPSVCALTAVASLTTVSRRTAS